MIAPLDAIYDLSKDLPIDVSLIEEDMKPLKGRSLRDQYFGLSDLCQGKALKDTAWSLLAGRILIHEIKSQVAPTFSQATKQIRSMCYDNYFSFVMDHSEELNSLIKEDRDWGFDFFAVHTLLKSYLCKIKREGVSYLMETPQYMYLRVATFLGFPDMAIIKEIYNDLSKGNYTHASPTLFNAGLFRPQLGSCFLMGVEDDLESIVKLWNNVAFISKNSGGIGIDITSLRHSEIGKNWFTNRGIIPWIRILDCMLDCIDQGGRRKGSGAIYLQPWHLDIEEFLELRKGNGPEKMRARDLFYALWVPDLFMKRVRSDENWTLFCPNKAKNLETKWGLEFEMAYLQFEKKAKSGKIQHRTIRARDLWAKIILTQIETGMPYILYADACNRKSNQQNLGTIRCSNLCAEIIEYTDSENIASCNLASVALNSCVTDKAPVKPCKIILTQEDQKKLETITQLKFKTPNEVWNFYTYDQEELPPKWFILRYGDCSEINVLHFDFVKLERLVRALVRNLNLVIDVTYYPPQVPKIETCNKSNRPLGIGVQGLADTFALLDLTWESPDAKQLNHDIFETMYFAAITESVNLAKRDGAYKTFEGSPASKGLFQFDLWNREKEQRRSLNKALKNLKATPEDFIREDLEEPDSRYNWNSLRKEMMEHGLRNSLLIALMPTASSASILSNNECFEPFTGMMYARKVLSGQFKFVNKHLVKDLKEIGLWDQKTSRAIIKAGGSVQGLTTDDENISSRLEHIKRKYKTVYELPQKLLLQLALDRGRFVCQSQSFNCWMANPTYTKLNAYHFYAWMNGAKTGMYYLRQLAKFDPVDFTELREECTDEVCVSCQS